MKKFNWGTGIFAFLTVFLLSAVGFIIFAFRQDVSLVHQDYYQKGADFSDQMKIEARSEVFRDSLYSFMEDGFFIVEFAESLRHKIDSGVGLMYRPSDSDEDVRYAIDEHKKLIIPRADLISGRYILKMYWYADGLKYEIDQAVNIQ